MICYLCPAGASCWRRACFAGGALPGFPPAVWGVAYTVGAILYGLEAKSGSCVFHLFVLAGRAPFLLHLPVFDVIRRGTALPWGDSAVPSTAPKAPARSPPCPCLQCHRKGRTPRHSAAGCAGSRSDAVALVRATPELISEACPREVPTPSSITFSKMSSPPAPRYADSPGAVRLAPKCRGERRFPQWAGESASRIGPGARLLHPQL